MKQILYSCVVCIFCACQCQSGYIPEWHQEIRYDLDANNVSSVKSHEIVPFTRSLVHAKDFWVYKDSVLVVLNKPTADHFVEFYNINSEKCYAKVIRKGNGPGEMLNCNARLNNCSLYVRDFVKGNYVVIDIDEIIGCYGDDYKLEEFKPYREYVSAYDIHEISSEKHLYLNPYCFSSVVDGIDNKEPRFFYEGTWKPDMKKLNAYNVSQGHILVNERDSLILFAGLDLNQIEIYDYALNPLTKIVGPKNLHPRYSFHDGRVAFDKVAFYNYLGVCDAENGFYVTYSGEEIGKARGVYIFQFDWTGNRIRSCFVNKYIATISLSSDHRYIFARGKDEDGSVVLYKLDLKGD